VIKEKENNLRKGLSQMGLSHNAYWISEMIYSIIITAFMTLSLILFGTLFKFEFFTECPFVV
jgi:hypothetical protein